MGGWYQQASGELFRGFAISPDDVVVDVGCGLGGNSLFCANQGAYVIFTDPDADKVHALQSRMENSSARGWDGHVSDSSPLPIADNTATRVILSEVLEHVEHPAKLMAEVVRIAQPGALFFLSVPDAEGERLQKKVAPDAHFKAPNHIHIFERIQFTELVQNAGLTILHHELYGFYWSIWMTLYWATASTSGENAKEATHENLEPPFHPLLEDWSKVWQHVIRLPEGNQIRQALDQILPKNQIIIARKQLI